MVEYPPERLDGVYAALAHPVRRTLLEHLRLREARVTELAVPFAISLEAVSKHIRVLESAGLVRRTWSGTSAGAGTYSLDTRSHLAGPLSKLLGGQAGPSGGQVAR